MPAQQIHGGECFHRRHVAGTGHHDIGLGIRIGTRPIEYADAALAMASPRFHVEPLGLRLLAGDDHVDEIAATQALVRDQSNVLASGAR